MNPVNKLQYADLKDAFDNQCKQDLLKQSRLVGANVAIALSISSNFILQMEKIDVNELDNLQKEYKMKLVNQDQDFHFDVGEERNRRKSKGEKKRSKRNRNRGIFE